MRSILYSVVVLIAYTTLVWRGVNLLPTSDRSDASSSARSSVRGYRGHTSFFSFHGGK